MSNINLIRIKAVYNALEDLQNKVVFVGGAIVSLYAKSKKFEIRPTDDIDVIVEILNYKERMELEEKLRSIGFQHDIYSSIICRYKIKGIIVDIMPTDDESIGFKNKWYSAGYKNAIDHKIDQRVTIKILNAPYFIATKIEAYKGRGKNDGRTSKDFEDIIFILENRNNIWSEMKESEAELREYLKQEFQTFNNNPNIFEWIDCHVDRKYPPASYNILNELNLFCK